MVARQRVRASASSDIPHCEPERKEKRGRGINERSQNERAIYSAGVLATSTTQNTNSLLSVAEGGLTIASKSNGDISSPYQGAVVTKQVLSNYILKSTGT